MADAIVVNEDGIAVRDSLGNGFRSPKLEATGIWVGDSDGPIREWGYWTLDAFYGSFRTFFADVDGDGVADAIALNADYLGVNVDPNNPNGVWVRRSMFKDYFGVQGRIQKCRP